MESAVAPVEVLVVDVVCAEPKLNRGGDGPIAVCIQMTMEKHEKMYLLFRESVMHTLSLY